MLSTIRSKIATVLSLTSNVTAGLPKGKVLGAKLMFFEVYENGVSKMVQKC